MSRPAAKMPGGRSHGGNFTEGPVHKHLIRLAGFMFMGFSAMTLSQLIEAGTVSAYSVPMVRQP